LAKKPSSTGFFRITRWQSLITTLFTTSLTRPTKMVSKRRRGITTLSPIWWKLAKEIISKILYLEWRFPNWSSKKKCEKRSDWKRYMG